METLNSMLYLLSYNSEVTTHALGVLSSYTLYTQVIFGYTRLHENSSLENINASFHSIYLSKKFQIFATVHNFSKISILSPNLNAY